MSRTFYGAGVPDNVGNNPIAALGLVPFALNQAAQARRRATRWDAVVSHWSLPCALSAAAARGGRPHLAVFHSADVHALSRLPARHLLAECIVRGATAFWFVAGVIRERFLELLKPATARFVEANSLIAPMGVGAIEPRRPRPSSPKPLFRALALGRLVPIKGLHLAIEAVASLPNVRLTIAGEGPERARLEAHARRRAPGQVEFAGPVFGAEKQALLASSDALVVPSTNEGTRCEGMPVVILEAMGAGLPVIATATGGIGEVVAHRDNGLLCSPAVRSVRDALTSLQRDAEMQDALSRAGMETARRYSWQRLGRTAAALLEVS